MNEPISDIVFVVGLFGLGGWVAWLIARSGRERGRERARRAQVVEARLAELSTAEELAGFLRSSPGRSWLLDTASERGAHVGLLTLLGIGLVALAVGAALFVNSSRLEGAVDPDLVHAAADASWWGTLLVGLGVGALAAAAILTRVARSWGILGGRSEPGGNDAGSQ